MQEDLFQKWKERFCRDAAEDEMAVFRSCMQKNSLPDDPDKLLKGTIMVVSAFYAYLKMDGHSFNDFLAMQTYCPSSNESVKYALTFNLFDKVYARILTSNDFIGIDLADLHDHPWDEFKRCGFTEFSVSRIDDSALSKDEVDHIDKLIEDDLRYDFSEEEVVFYIDEYRIEGSLIVCVYDHEGRFSKGE